MRLNLLHTVEMETVLELTYGGHWFARSSWVGDTGGRKRNGDNKRVKMEGENGPSIYINCSVLLIHILIINKNNIEPTFYITDEV